MLRWLFGKGKEVELSPVQEPVADQATTDSPIVDQATTDSPLTGQESEPQLPKVMDVGDYFAPEIPRDMSDIGIEPEVLADLVLKLAYSVPHLTTERAVQQLCLPLPTITELVDELVKDKLVVILGEAGPLNYRLAITEHGRERARWLLEFSGYVGPAPVSLDDYTSAMKWQYDRLPMASPEQVKATIADLVLPEAVVQVIGLAVSSGRSLFLYGPPGNGKTSVGQLLHQAMPGAMWIPYCIGVEGRVIRMFDPRFHQSAPLGLSQEESVEIDRRWVRIHRPMIVVGGELTLEDLDLTYDSQLRSYEAPVQLKANGGVVLLDDFGCQPVEPHRLLNRWINPLESQIDHLTLRTGQKLQVPFLQMLVVSTNLDPDVVMTPALLRRMGYRLHLEAPSPHQFAQIFERYAALCEAAVPPNLVEWLIERHQAEQRDLRGCTPRDLIERCRDICRYTGQQLELNKEILDLAWRSYFG